MKKLCNHTGLRHMVEKFDKGFPEKLWMCCGCGEIIGRYLYRNTTGCEYIPEKHHWVRPNGKIISEYR